MRRVSFTALAGAALLTMPAGCAEKPADPGVATANGGVRSSAAPPAGVGQAAFEACLLRNGVDITELEGVDAQAMTEAAEKCKAFAPGGGDLPRISAAEVEQIRAFARCVRDKGVADFPDPAADGSLPADYAPSPAQREKLMSIYPECMAGMAG